MILILKYVIFFNHVLLTAFLKESSLTYVFFKYNFFRSFQTKLVFNSNTTSFVNNFYSSFSNFFKTESTSLVDFNNSVIFFNLNRKISGDCILLLVQFQKVLNQMV